MATITSTPTGGALTVNGNTQVSGTISWSKPTIPSGATISSCVLTGTATASMSKGSATITVNGTTVTSGTQFTINLGTANNTTSVTTTAKGGNKNSKGTVSFSNLVYTVEYTLDIPVTGITLSPTNITVQQNKSVIVNAILTPNGSTDEIIWSINDTNIATLTTQASSTQIGINGKTVGEATITATTVKSGISVSEKVTVEPLIVESKVEVYLYTGFYGTAGGQSEKITDYSSIIDVDFSGTGEYFSSKPLNINIIDKTYSLYEIQYYSNDPVYGYRQLYNHEEIHNNKYIAEYSFNGEVTLREDYTLKIYLFQDEFKTFYTVTFKDWDGTVIKTETVEEGTSATTPSSPSRDGYKFTGWDVNFSNVTSDLTVTAQYILDTTFSGAGTIVENLSGEYSIGLKLNIDWNTQVVDVDLSFSSFENLTGSYSGNVKIFDMWLPNISESYELRYSWAYSGSTHAINVYQKSKNMEDSSAIETTIEEDDTVSGRVTVRLFKDEDGYLNFDFIQDGVLVYSTNLFTTAPENLIYIGDYNGVNVPDNVTFNSVKIIELENEEPEPEIPVEKTIALRPISATQDSGYNNTWTDIANTYDTDTSTSGTIIVTGSSQTGFKRNYVDTIFNFDNPIPANATINSAVLTIRAKQSATTNLNMTVSIGSDEVIGSTLLSSSSANYTADIANYVKDLNQLNINLTSAATSNRTFTLYDVRVDVNYTAYEMPKPTYTVTFKDWDGTTLKIETVEEGVSATAPSNPSRVGYEFTGWDKDFNNITSDLIVTAQYEKELEVIEWTGIGTVASGLNSGIKHSNYKIILDLDNEYFDIISQNCTYTDNGVAATYVCSIQINNNTYRYQFYEGCIALQQQQESMNVNVYEWDPYEFPNTLRFTKDGIYCLYGEENVKIGEIEYGNDNAIYILEDDKYNTDFSIDFDLVVGELPNEEPEEELIEWTGIGTVATDLKAHAGDNGYSHDSYKINLDWENESFDIIITDELNRNSSYIYNLGSIGDIKIGDIGFSVVFADGAIDIYCTNTDNVLGYYNSDYGNFPFVVSFTKKGIYVKSSANTGEYSTPELLSGSENIYEINQPIYLIDDGLISSSVSNQENPKYNILFDLAVSEYSEQTEEPEEPGLTEPVDGYIAKNLVSHGDWSYTFNIDWDTQYLDIEVLNYKLGIFRTDYYYVISNNSYNEDYSHESVDDFIIHGVEVESGRNDIDIIRYSKVDGVCIITSNGTQIIPGNSFANDNKMTIKAVIPTEWLKLEDGVMTFNIKITDITPPEEPDNNELIQGDINDETGAFADEVPNVVKTRYIDISNKKQILVNVLTEDVYVLKCYLYNANKELVKVIDISTDKKRMFGLDLQKIIDEVMNDGNE